MKKRTRNIQIIFFVNDEENELIKKRMKIAGFSDRSAYLRKRAIDVSLIHVDTSALEKEINQLSVAISKIGVNINQIARNVNATGNIKSNEMQEVLSLMNQLNHLNNSYAKTVNNTIALNSEYQEE